MRATGTYLLVLLLSLLIADASASVSLRLGSPKALFQIPSWDKTSTSIATYSSKTKGKWDEVSSKLRSHYDRFHVGEIVDGISMVQDCLDYFGYLKSALNSDTTLNSNTFTLELQSAVKNFQRNFNNVSDTGQLDNDTVSLILSPRCGLADYTDGFALINSMNQTEATYYKWGWPHDKRELTYAFSPNNDTTSYKKVFSAAFGLWENKTGLKFTETTSFDESDIQILFVSFDEKLGVVAAGGPDNETKRWVVAFDDKENWALQSHVTAESDSLDLKWSVAHQIGHALGLTHSSIEEAIMYPLVVPGKERNLAFAEDDLQRIQSSPDIGRHVTDGVAAVGPRWRLVSPMWLGIMLLFCF